MLHSAYPEECSATSFIVLAEELGGMFIWINGFGDPYMKGGRGGGQQLHHPHDRLQQQGAQEDLSDGVLTRLDRNRRVRNAKPDQRRSLQPQQHRRDPDPAGPRRPDPSTS